MDCELIVPEELQTRFRRMLNRFPEEIRDDAPLQRMMLVFLKVGGENLVRQHIEISKIRLEDKIKIPQYPLLKRICPDDVDLEDEDQDEDGDNDDGPDFD